MISPSSDHKKIYSAMVHLQAHGQAVDRITLLDELTRRGELPNIRVSYVTSLDDGLPLIPDLESYLRILQEQTAQLRILNQAEHLINRVKCGEDSAAIVAGAQEFFAGLADGSRGRAGYRLGEIPSVFEFAGAEPEYVRRPELPKGNLIVFTGLPEAGKSSLAFAFARDARISFGVPVLVLDRDNPANVVANRMSRLAIQDGPRTRFEIMGGWLGPRAPQPDSPLILN
jgi:replicative DNA helicase